MRTHHELIKQGDAARQSRLEASNEQSKVTAEMQRLLAEALAKQATAQAGLLAAVDRKLVTTANAAHTVSSTQVVDIIKLVQGTLIQPDIQRLDNVSNHKRQEVSSDPCGHHSRGGAKRRAEASPMSSPAKVKKPLDQWSSTEVRAWFVDNQLLLMVPVCCDELDMRGSGLRIFTVAHFVDFPTLNTATLYHKQLYEVCRAALLNSHQA